MNIYKSKRKLSTKKMNIWSLL